MLTIGKKLLFGKVFMLVLLMIIVLVGIYSINNLSKTANNMEIEYNEVNIAHGLQISFQHILLSLKNYQLKGQNSEKIKFKYYLAKTKEKIIKSKEVITNNHNKKHLTNFENDIIIVESLSQKLFKLDNNVDKVATNVLMEEISSIADLAINEINEVSVESEKEMNKYIIRNSETNTKGKESIILIGLITACCLMIGSFFFLKSIMKPINHLMQTTQNISSDNLSVNAPIETHDEIGNLVQSFNNMIGILDRTTVSRDYFDNILSRMDDSLIITDAKTKIKVINQATLTLLGYTEEEIVGLPFSVILGEKIDNETFTRNTIINDLTKQEHLHNIYNTYYTKEGDKIPVLFSGSLMHNEKGAAKGMVCIANHHIVESNIQENTTPLSDETTSGIQTLNTVGKIPLTKREREIMKLIAEELNNQEIAEKLFISVRTVETHRKNIMQKLHTKSVIALVKYAALNEII